MEKDSFVHLHGHSHYSLLDGEATISGLCTRAKELGMPALGLTDHGNLFGLVEFYQTARETGIKPIVGCEFYVAPGSRFDKDAHGISDAAYHLVVLAKDQTGYKNLIKLASLAYLDGYYYRPRVDKEILARYSQGLIVINGHMKTEIAENLRKNDFDAAVATAGQYKEIFGENFFVELQNHDDPAEIQLIPKLLEVARRTGCPYVATNDHHYLVPEDYDAHDVLCCISMGKTLDDRNRLRYSRHLYLKSPQEMRHIFRDLPEACDNTLKIAEMCNLELDFSQRHAPVYKPPEDPKTGKTPSADEYLRQLCERGLVEKYPAVTDGLRQRLEQELKVIQSKGFSSYFLIVWDFCNFARNQGIPAGARGSGVGTLVGYVLGLCDVDPVRYDLLFERFMDPSRSEMPDIDIDICQEGRAKIIEYVRGKYGHVSQIITFSTLGAKAAIKDVGRVMGMPLPEVDKITKLIPSGLNVTLENALATTELRKLYRENPNITRLFDIAQRLEGLCRNAGMHAAGVIVCDKPLDEVVPLYKTGEEVMTQWDGPTCEKAGLLKIDFLGLRTLTILEGALQLIQADFKDGLPSRAAAGDSATTLTHPEVPGRPGRIDLEKIDLTDQSVYQRIFQKGQTRGVFQFESPGMRDLLIKMKPDRIEDLIAANALFRPGPMDLIPDYCARKHGREPAPRVHPKMDEILAETYGIMVYQEQVMRIFNQLGGVPLARAYKIIKAISKKDEAKIASERENFIEGAAVHGIKREQAQKFFSLIEEFGKYGFNKSHSTRYAIVAFQTAYLKTYFPHQFMAALLTFEMVDQKKIAEYIDECRFIRRPDSQTGIAVLPPDINLSTADFRVVQETIRFGLAAVKGVGEKAVEAIIVARGSGEGSSIKPFKSIYDFCERVDLRVVNKAVIEALIKCGAFDSLHSNRAAALTAMEHAVQLGSVSQESQRSGQNSLFGGSSSGAVAPAEFKLPDVPEWPQGEKMAFEKAALGFYVTSHPLRDYEALLRSFTTINSQTLVAAPDRKEAIIGGLVSKVEVRIAKSGRNIGQKWATVILEDLHSAARITLFSEAYQKYAHLLAPEAIVFFRGKVDRSREEPAFLAADVFTPQQVKEKLTREVIVRADASAIDDVTLERFDQVLRKYSSGKTPVRMELMDASHEPPLTVQMTLGRTIALSSEAMEELREAIRDCSINCLGPGAVLATPQNMPPSPAMAV
ncbi:MAG TPA: DNA polymerase III subunit alpha [Phycisphaerae bacterium]|nr:DNA polymerase III subunit alpha [Phycisphaerae bacterium]